MSLPLLFLASTVAAAEAAAGLAEPPPVAPPLFLASLPRLHISPLCASHSFLDLASPPLPLLPYPSLHSPLRPSPSSPSGGEFPALPATPLGGVRRVSGGTTAASSLKTPLPLTATHDKYTLPSRLVNVFALSHMHSHMHLHIVFPSMQHASSLQAKPPAAA
ncbi:unnamed protein product [Closterium sp. Naga37s-1]|nr:unnamed protein product [Closterium sp. Naga37s-1]